MATKTIKIIVAEGNHDAAFIARVMKANGYHDPRTRVNDIEPAFLSEYVKRLFGELSFDRSVQKVQRRPLPSFLLSREVEKGEEVVLVFAVDGQDNGKNLTRILETFVMIKSNDFGKEQLENVEDIKVIFNLDADEDGIEARMTKINGFIKALTDDNFPCITNYGKCFYKEIVWGGFISANGEGHGAVEEFILPLFEENNKALVEEVDAFLEKKDAYQIPQTRKYNEKKARIGIMGQLDMPGMSNTVLIDQSKIISENSLSEGMYKKIGDYIREF